MVHPPSPALEKNATRRIDEQQAGRTVPAPVQMPAGTPDEDARGRGTHRSSLSQVGRGSRLRGSRSWPPAPASEEPRERPRQQTDGNTNGAHTPRNPDPKPEHGRRRRP
ncbi:Uncharacterised protein [Amycolatopsis camponoti]|uniref:Uncharacterized protein n=1 Tax=Amycolatopsis camponoti TaxID=2606593 RepID=A0A6I8LIT5_9PSEU|nr:Uncharacterised protein [Amycolatopsis camponoti]